MSHVAESSLNRRGFLGAAGAALSAGAWAGATVQPEALAAAPSMRSEIRITRITGFIVWATRWKDIGASSQGLKHVNWGRDWVVRIETDAGIEGIGAARYQHTPPDTFVGREHAVPLLGKDPLSFFKPGIGIISPLGQSDSALWDLAGKILGQPAWELMGGYGPEWVPVYDGTIMMADLYPEYDGIDRVLYEVEHGLNSGHRAFKIKIGRGFMHMEPEAGLRRDVDVVRAVRRLVGPDITLMVDSNTGYDLATTKQFLEGVDDEFYFVEEMFPETIEECLEFKEWLRARGWNTRVADGEHARDLETLRPYIEANAMDVLQADMRRLGFTRLLELSRMTARTSITLAPHNSGSFMGGYMQAHLGRAIPNFAIAEIDLLDQDVVEVPGFEFKEGRMRPPDTPGCGWIFHPDRVARAREHTLDWEVS